ncbi:hypothetical protein Hypma_003095 [Hypsizygus marmoreus]|uniref:Uncharacterized protein n=1 Tax=Hypsizygus marmoreus TaxID=39966 RepID=A0A369JBK0_HYPMA|nr:hypothetical protein Hypma_003095 [Hypsizygus marmoreus]
MQNTGRCFEFGGEAADALAMPKWIWYIHQEGLSTTVSYKWFTKHGTQTDSKNTGPLNDVATRSLYTMEELSLGEFCIRQQMDSRHRCQDHLDAISDVRLHLEVSARWNPQLRGPRCLVSMSSRHFIQVSSPPLSVASCDNHVVQSSGNEISLTTISYAPCIAPCFRSRISGAIFLCLFGLFLSQIRFAALSRGIKSWVKWTVFPHLPFPSFSFCTHSRSLLHSCLPSVYSDTYWIFTLDFNFPLCACSFSPRQCCPFSSIVLYMAPTLYARWLLIQGAPSSDVEFSWMLTTFSLHCKSVAMESSTLSSSLSLLLLQVISLSL